MTFDQFYERLKASFVRSGWITAMLCTILTAAWMTYVLALGLDRPGDQIFREYPRLFRLNFATAFFIDFFHVPVALALGLVVLRRAPGRALLGTVFYIMVLPLNLACYFLNGAILPRIYESATGTATVESTVVAIVDIGSRLSLWGGMDFLGYGVLGIGGALLGSALFGRGRLWSVAGCLGILTGLLSTLGAVGLYIDSTPLALCCPAGGFLAAAFTAVLVPAFLHETENAPSCERTSPPSAQAA